MKLENCDWVPSHVVYWLSKKLEEKGIPGTSYSHTLLSYLHPYFCPHPSSKDPRQKDCLGKETSQLEEFDDSIDSDADFPQENKNTSRNNSGSKRIEREVYFKKAVECLASASDKTEELERLVWELFDILGTNFSDTGVGLGEEAISNPIQLNSIELDFLCVEPPSINPDSELAWQAANPLPTASIDNINDDQPAVSHRGNQREHLQMNCEGSMRENTLAAAGDHSSMSMSSSFGGGVATPASIKEEWEYLAQIVNAQHGVTPPAQLNGSRLFERASGIPDPFHHSPGLGLSRLQSRMVDERWEDSLNIWNSENSVNANFAAAMSERLRTPFNSIDGVYPEERITPPERIWEPEVDAVGLFADTQGTDVSMPCGQRQDPIGSQFLEPTSLSSEANIGGERSPNIGENPWPTSNSLFVTDDRLPCGEHAASQKTLEDELSKSFRQLGIDIWKGRRRDIFSTTSDHFQPLLPSDSDAAPDSCYDLRSKDSSLDVHDLFAKIPRGPVGPYAELNHTETSGFSSVIPQREVQLARRTTDLGRSELFGMADPYDGGSGSEEKENLLTSPRTHFKPIMLESQGSSEDDKDEVQVVSEAQTNFQNSEFLFQRTGSGNLILENDFVEGSPKKYMVYKEPQSKFVVGDSPYVVEASPATNLDACASSFAPKFQISNNEKFSQTEPTCSILLPPSVSCDYVRFENDRFNTRYPKNTDSIWESNFQENIKKIWNKEDNRCGGKEVWEIAMENVPLPFGDCEQAWCKKGDLDGVENAAGACKSLFKKPDQEGQDVLSRIKFLWPISGKDRGDSPVGNTDRRTYLGSSWSKGDDNSERYDAPSWESERDKTDGGDPLRTGEDNRSDGWKKWSFQDSGDMNLAPLGSPSSKPKQKDGEKDVSSMEDLEILEPDWNLNEGFEWDSTAPEETTDVDSNEREVFYCEIDGQQVILPVEYFEDDVYDKYFGSSESKLGRSLPDLPYSETADGKKIPIKIKRKGSRASHSSRPCTFYLEGNCLRTDCKFTHDLSSITCRFWLEDACFKAETCPFLHGYPTHRKRNRSEGDQTCSDAVSLAKLKETCKAGSKSRSIKTSRPPPSSFEIDSEADFPSLGSSYESRTNSLEEISCAALNKVTGKKAKFVSVPNSMPKQVETKGASGKGGSQRRKKTKSDNGTASSRRSMDKQSSGSGSTPFKCAIPSPKPSCHDDGTVSDF